MRWWATTHVGRRWAMRITTSSTTAAWLVSWSTTTTLIITTTSASAAAAAAAAAAVPALVGNDNDDDDDDADLSPEKVRAMKGARDVVGQWNEDPHGVGDLLAGKRRRRNFWETDQMLFLSPDERLRSGLKTRLIGTDVEVLVDGAARPWAS